MPREPEGRDPQVVPLLVFSGREQPPAETRPVRLRTPVVVQTRGLGPPRVLVEGPDGARVPTVDAPLLHDGAVSGTEQRFTPTVAGTYRLTLVDAPTTVLALLTAR